MHLNGLIGEFGNKDYIVFIHCITLQVCYHLCGVGIVASWMDGFTDHCSNRDLVVDKSSY
jgi:hypothetical protein